MDAAVAHEEDAVDFRGDVCEVVSYKDEAGGVAFCIWLHQAAHGFAEGALGGEVEGVGGFVEEELAGAVDEGAGDEDASFFAGGHFADGLLG